MVEFRRGNDSAFVIIVGVDSCYVAFLLGNSLPTEMASLLAVGAGIL